MEEDKRTSFLQLSKKECENIYGPVIANGKSLLEAGEKCAADGKYGLAVSLEILGIEETIKGTLLFAKSQGVLVEKVPEMKRAITGDHETRHETVALFELIGLVKMIAGLLSDLKKIVRDFMKDPVTVLEDFFEGKTITPFDSIEWWSQANERKNNGFYSAYNSGLQLPSDTTQEQYAECKKAIDSALRSVELIFRIFREEKDTTKLVRNINAGLDLHSKPRGYYTKARYQNDKLGWPEYIPPVATKLLLGTFPTEKKNRDFEFFYPNKLNRFWMVLSEISGVELIHQKGDDAVKERKAVLDALKLGISDTGYKILRQQESSLDGHLFPIEFTNVFEILTNHPGINKIILTSSSGENSALAWFTAYCSLNGVKFVMLPKKGLPKYSSFLFQRRTIDVVAINSPSRRATIKKDPLIQMYRDVLDHKESLET